MSAALATAITELTDTLGGKFNAMYADVFWLIMCGILVFLMQCGFAILEAGSVRSKNTKNILLKNMLDACIGAIIWFVWGHGLAYDGNDNSFMGSASDGGASFLMWGYIASEDSTGYTFASWWFQFVFAAAAATIVSGAMAERTQLGAYVIYTVVITGLIYPVVVHWVWSSSGWASAFNSNTGALAPLMSGQVDFAGSGVVHMTGGIAALCGAGIIGPRRGRFDENKKPVEIQGHSTTLQVMGTFILWFGWYGFNPGSTLGIAPESYARDAARSVVTTTIGAAAGGLTVIVLDKTLGSKTWSVSAVCNGILGGLVSVTANCVVVTTWAAFLIGVIGGFVYFGASNIVLKVCKIDDALDAFAVHGACGFWGCVAAGLFAYPAYGYGACSGGGALYGNGNCLGIALAALFAEVGWVATMSCLLFGTLRACKVLRISEEVEDAGMDVSKHGGSAYEKA
jgi:Amt family ammonium transporter